MKFLDVFQSKELNELLGIIRKNSEALESQSRVIVSMQGEISSMKDCISGLGADNRELASNVKGAVASVERLNSELEDSITDLKVLKGHLQAKVADKIEEEFKSLLRRFEKDVDAISKLKAEISSMHSETAKLKDEIDKLNKISSSIRSSDFELSNYAKRLQADDAEKLRLMRQIDTLERLVSQLRRGNR